jgi:hypothetical protein
MEQGLGEENNIQWCLCNDEAEDRKLLNIFTQRRQEVYNA